jgi:hypothetical protein
MDMILEQIAATMPGTRELVRTVMRMLAAPAVGAQIGYQRERMRKAAGFRRSRAVGHSSNRRRNGVDSARCPASASAGAEGPEPSTLRITPGSLQRLGLNSTFQRASLQYPQSAPRNHLPALASAFSCQLSQLTAIEAQSPPLGWENVPP